MTLDPKEMGARLKGAREARQLGQKHLADASGTTQSYISQIERGEIDDPSAFVVRDIEALLGVYPGYLTEPAEVRQARETAISRLVQEHGRELGITPDIETELRLRFASLDPGPNPPLIYLVKLVEMVKTLLAVKT